MDYVKEIFGGIAILVGILLYFYRNKRKFDRTNAAGIEQFTSYSGKLGSRLGDMALWFIAVFFILFGALLLAENHQDTWGGYIYLIILIIPILVVFLYRNK